MTLNDEIMLALETITFLQQCSVQSLRRFPCTQWPTPPLAPPQHHRLRKPLLHIWKGKYQQTCKYHTLSAIQGFHSLVQLTCTVMRSRAASMAIQTRSMTCAPAGMPGVHEKARCMVKGGAEDEASPVRASAAAAAACASGTSGHGTSANAAVRLFCRDVACSDMGGGDHSGHVTENYSFSCHFRCRWKSTWKI